MITLTRDFHAFASRVATDFPAIFFPIRHITKALYVRTLLGGWICHFDLSFRIFLP